MKHKKNILFSIIIPTYNRAHMIGRAIESVLGQTYPHFELIVVDDGSTDNTREVVRSFDDGRIRYYYKKNEERSIARNYGIDKSEGKYICFMDDDDYYLPDFMMDFSIAIGANQFPIAVFICNEYLEKNRKKILVNVHHAITENPVLAIWEKQPCIRQLSIHREILSDIRFDNRFTIGEDFHLIIRIAIKYPFYKIDKALCVYVYHADRTSTMKFKEKIRLNAFCSLEYIDDIIKNFNRHFYSVPQSVISDYFNRKVYAFASAAMKSYDFILFKDLFKKIRYDGSVIKTVYYLLSLFIRLPIYFLGKYTKISIKQ